MKVKVTREHFIKGEFTAKYWGEPIGGYNEQRFSINPYEIEITNATDVSVEEVESLNPENFQQYAKLPQATISYSSSENTNPNWFREDIFNAKLIDIEIVNPIKAEGKSFGTLNGKIIFSLLYEEEIEQIEVPEEVAVKPVVKRRIRPVKQPVTYEYLGCLDILSWFSYIFFLIIWVPLIFSLGFSFGASLLGIAAIWLFITFTSKSFVNFGKWFLRIVSTVFITISLLGIFSLFFTDTFVRPNIFPEAEKDEISTLINDSLIRHHRVWSDFNHRNYQGDIELLVADYNDSRQFRISDKVPVYSDKDWHNLYESFVKHDKDKLNRIYQMIDSQRTVRKLSRPALADMIVCMVQDIPYTLIASEACGSTERSEDLVNLANKKISCLGNINHGVQTPVEFMGNLKGDCDTRTVLLHTLLSRFDFDVIVIGSSLYRHSMIGVNLPGFGKYKMHQGKRYYTWETTSRGHQLGEISPEWSNMDNWTVHLNGTSEL